VENISEIVFAGNFLRGSNMRHFIEIEGNISDKNDRKEHKEKH